MRTQPTPSIRITAFLCSISAQNGLVTVVPDDRAWVSLRENKRRHLQDFQMVDRDQAGAVTTQFPRLQLRYFHIFQIFVLELHPSTQTIVKIILVSWKQTGGAKVKDAWRWLNAWWGFLGLERSVALHLPPVAASPRLKSGSYEAR